MKSLWLTLSLLLAMSNTLAMAHDSVENLLPPSDFIELVTDNHDSQ
ncbi:hypothetical protein GP5015_499 [gamma proteobacterium HTCC5015]|nr:hypothetical protein GP5015_499 [gamma proteobacterium HTCC5015]